MPRYGIIIDLNRCTGCMTCVIACKQENLTRPDIWWNKILEIETSSPDRINYVRFGCMHCNDPPCIKACSTKAIYKRNDGIVLIDHKKCMGKGDCINACPYGVIGINPKEDYFPDQKPPYLDEVDPHRIHPPGKASTCTLCAHRIDLGREPACVEGCPSKAMVFGDLDDPASPIRKKFTSSISLLSAKGTNPKVRYTGDENLLKKLEQKIENTIAEVKHLKKERV